MGSVLHSLGILFIVDVVLFVDCRPCDSSQCLNGGLCANGAYNNSLCLCLPEYTGERCELAVWPIWSDTPAVIVKRGEAAKLNCQYKTIPTSDEYVITWQYVQQDNINNVLVKTMWTYSNTGEEISSDFNGKIRSNDTTNIRSKHTLYYLNADEDSSVRCNVKISNNAFATITIRMEVRNATGGADAFPVSSTMPSINAEVGSSADFRCDFGKVENLAGLSVTWYYGNVQFSTEKTIWRTLRGQEGSADPTNCGSLCEFVDTGAPLSNSHSIRIKDISLQREGYYMCLVVADNGKKQGNATTHLTVLVPPTPKFNLTPDDPYVGDTVTITCTAPAVKPAANVSMWLDVAGVKYNDTVNIEIEDKTSIVTLSTDVVVSEQHHGQSVMCGAVWRNMMYESDTQMLYVKYPPQSVTISTNSVFPIKESSLLTVTCTAVGGNPQPKLEIINKRNSLHDSLGNSPLSLTVNRTHHGSELQCSASGGGIKSDFLLSNLISISVYYSASTVKIDGVTTDIQETDILNLTCSAEGGNPDNYTYRWNFIPKYGGADSNTFGDTAQLAVPNLNYTNAGHYRCQASNIGGATSIVKVVTIKFSPVVLEDGFKRLVYTDVNQEVDLTVPFLSYPPPTSVTWVSPSMSEITRTWEAVGQDRLRTVLRINTANYKNFGWYKCTIRNSEGVLQQNIELRKGRRPFPATDAKASKITAFSMLLEWTAGEDGGSSQTFKVIYRVNGVNKLNKEGISDPGEGRRGSLLITGLTPKTTYGLWIIGENAIGDSDPSILSVQTRGLPSTPEIRIIQTNNEAEISWEAPGDYDTALLVQCRVDPDKDYSMCTNYSVSGEASRHVVEADPAVTYTYRLELYQYDVKVASTEDVRKEPVPDENSARTISTENNVAAVAGGSVGGCVLVIGIIAVLGVIWHRKKSSHKKPETVYQNSDAAATVYESNISLDMSQPVSPYTAFSVTATTTPDGCSDGVYEDVHMLDSMPASCLRLPGAVLHRGLYTTTVLTTVTGASHLTDGSQVVAKVVNKKCIPGKMALTQEVEALRKVKFHKNLAVYTGYNITSQEPAFLLSERASQGDLLSYLQTAQRVGLNLPQADLMHFVGGIVSGLRHLHAQNPPLVMHCLNCSHVLLADNLTCQLTGFGYSRDVSLRHQYADSVKYTKCDRWLAPEVLSSCEHSEASDVWSLGATVWEIFTLGSKPYCKYSDAGVKSHVLTGEIVLKTETIPTDIFTIIQQCMILNPDSRISLDQIEGNIIEKSQN